MSDFFRYLGRFLVLALILLTLVLGFLAIQILLVPLVGALFVVYLVKPTVIRLERRRFSSGNAFLMIMAVAIVGMAVVTLIGSSVVNLGEVTNPNVPFAEQVGARMSEFETALLEWAPVLETFDIVSSVIQGGSDLIVIFFENLRTEASTLAVQLLLIPFIAYFIIRDGRRVKRRLAEMVPNRYFERTLIVIYQIDKQVGGYFRGRLIESLAVGVSWLIVAGILSIWIDLPYIMFLAVVIGATNLIPYVGPLIGLTFGTVLYMGLGLQVASVLGLIIAVAIAQLLDNLVFAPVVLSQNVNLHPLTVVLVLVIGGNLMGVMGLIIAVPVAACIKIVTSEVYNTYRIQTE